MVLCCTFMNACPIKPTGSLPYGFYLKQIFNTTRKAENSQNLHFGKENIEQNIYPVESLEVKEIQF